MGYIYISGQNVYTFLCVLYVYVYIFGTLCSLYLSFKQFSNFIFKYNDF